jgi:hypothetical protein
MCLSIDAMHPPNGIFKPMAQLILLISMVPFCASAGGWTTEGGCAAGCGRVVDTTPSVSIWYNSKPAAGNQEILEFMGGGTTVSTNSNNACEPTAYGTNGRRAYFYRICPVEAIWMQQDSEYRPFQIPPRKDCYCKVCPIGYFCPNGVDAIRCRVVNPLFHQIHPGEATCNLSPDNTRAWSSSTEAELSETRRAVKCNSLIGTAGGAGTGWFKWTRGDQDSINKNWRYTQRLTDFMYDPDLHTESLIANGVVAHWEDGSVVTLLWDTILVEQPQGARDKKPPHTKMIQRRKIISPLHYPANTLPPRTITEKALTCISTVPGSPEPCFPAQPRLELYSSLYKYQVSDNPTRFEGVDAAIDAYVTHEKDIKDCGKPHHGGWGSIYEDEYVTYAACPADSYAAATTQVFTDNHGNSKTGVGTAKDCTMCPAGMLRVPDRTNFLPATVFSYSFVDDGSREIKCLVLSGAHDANNQNDWLNMCVGCSYGKYRVSNYASGCTDVPKGYYTPQSDGVGYMGLDQLLTCTETFEYTSTVGATRCEKCEDAGKGIQVHPNDPVLADGSQIRYCEQCPTGKYRTSISGERCLSCSHKDLSKTKSVDSTGPGGQEHLGWYVPNRWQTECVLCHQDDQNGVALSKLVKIDDTTCGHCGYNEHAYLGECYPCKAHTVCTEGSCGGHTGEIDGNPVRVGCDLCSDVQVSRDGACVTCGPNMIQDENSCRCRGAGLYEETEGVEEDGTDKVCSPAPPGTYSEANDPPELKDCSLGTYTVNSGSQICKPCPAGYHTPTVGWKTDCELCPIGHSCPGRATGALAVPCKAGTFNDQLGALLCVLCTGDKFCPDRGMDTPLTCVGETDLVGTSCVNCTGTTFPVSGPYNAEEKRYGGTCQVCSGCDVGSRIHTPCVQEGTPDTDDVCVPCLSEGYKCGTGQFLTGVFCSSSCFHPHGLNVLTRESPPNQPGCLVNKRRDFGETRACGDCSVGCAVGQYVEQICEGHQDWVCGNCTNGLQCPENHYFHRKCFGADQVDSLGAFSDDICVECTVNCGAGRFISKDTCEPTDSKDRQCSDCKSTCASDEWIDGDCSGTSLSDHTTCKPCRTCPDGTYISGICDGKQHSDVECLACTQDCGSTAYPAGDCDGLHHVDRVCVSCNASYCPIGKYRPQEEECTGDYTCYQCNSACATNQYVSKTCSDKRMDTNIECTGCKQECGSTSSTGFRLISPCDGQAEYDTASCLKCPVCDRGQYVKEKCQGLVDSVRTCAPCKKNCDDTYQLLFDPCGGNSGRDDSQCKQCYPTCPPGQYFINPCGGGGTNCLPCPTCPQNTYEINQCGGLFGGASMVNISISNDREMVVFGAEMGASIPRMCELCKWQCPVDHYLEINCHGKTDRDVNECKECKCDPGMYGHKRCSMGNHTTVDHAEEFECRTCITSCPENFYLRGECATNLAPPRCVECTEVCAAGYTRGSDTICGGTTDITCIRDVSCFTPCRAGTYRAQVNPKSS